MQKPTLTRADIIHAIYREIGLPQGEASVLLESIISHMTSALSRGETVKLSGFGVFSSLHKKERVGRNPRTGTAASISERQVVVFKPSQKLKTRVDFGCKKLSI